MIRLSNSFLDLKCKLLGQIFILRTKQRNERVEDKLNNKI